MRYEPTADANLGEVVGAWCVNAGGVVGSLDPPGGADPGGVDN